MNTDLMSSPCIGSAESQRTNTALEWFLTRVGPQVITQGVLSLETLATLCAREGPDQTVGSQVNQEVIPGLESLVALCAREWLLAAVTPQMQPKMLLLPESLVALCAGQIRPVRFPVEPHVCPVGESLVTLWTLERPLSRVKSFVNDAA